MILAINTAFSESDVAISFDKQNYFTSKPSSAKQSENILVCIDELLAKANKSLQDIDIISVVVGPGSFTGIRIGVGIVKGFSVAKPSLKLISICSLDLMANTVKEQISGEFWCVLNALSGNIFACKYDKNATRISQPEMLFGEDLNKLEGDIVGLKSENMELCNKYINFTPQDLMELTELKVGKHEFVDETELLPIYLRKSQAEIGLENKNDNKPN